MNYFDELYKELHKDPEYIKYYMSQIKKEAPCDLCQYTKLVHKEYLLSVCIREKKRVSRPYGKRHTQAMNCPKFKHVDNQWENNNERN